MVPKLCFSQHSSPSYFAYGNRTGNGPSAEEIFKITPVLVETFVLLTSSFTIGLGINAMRLGKKNAMMTFFAITLLLGLGFLGIEITEFVHYVHEGATIQTSGFPIRLVYNIRNTRCSRIAWFLLGIIHHDSSC